MNTIRYVEIENFKTFQEKVHIDLGHPTVLIGPNNAGKTSVIQALSLWSRGVSAWYAKKGEPKKRDSRERLSAGINRLNILDVPVSETRFFWNATRVRKGNKPIEMIINVGIEREGITKDCRFIFTYRDSEIIYCKPCSATVMDDDLLKIASQMPFHLLYPMSGIMSGVSADSEETPLPDGRIKVYLGQGLTAQVLRNICLKVVEHDEFHKTDGWEKITKIIQKIFMVTLNKPAFNEARGSLLMSYRQKGVDSPLDISLAGRGLQQVLLLLAYLFWHKGSVLLVDEPDAHLEILRQRQIYEILKHVALENGCQVIIATHSEVILDDAVDTNLTLLLHGKAVNLAQKQDMKHALRTFGIEHYYKAMVHPRILYLEGSTDIDMLRGFAKKIGHQRAIDVLDGHIYSYYTQDVEPDSSLDTRLDRVSGAYLHFKAHFHTLKRFVPALKGCAIFDGDNGHKTDSVEGDLAVCYWRRYEIENYFITKQSLISYTAHRLSTNNGPLLSTLYIDDFKQIVDACFLSFVFDGNKERLEEFNRASADMQSMVLKGVKMSALAELVFQKFAEKTRQAPLLNKGQFYQMIPYMPEKNIDKEVSEKLDILVNYLEYQNPH